VGAGNFVGVQRLFCPNSPNLPGKHLCDKLFPYKLSVAVSLAGLRSRSRRVGGFWVYTNQVHWFIHLTLLQWKSRVLKYRRYILQRLVFVAFTKIGHIKPLYGVVRHLWSINRYAYRTANEFPFSCTDRLRILFRKMFGCLVHNLLKFRDTIAVPNRVPKTP